MIGTILVCVIHYNAATFGVNIKVMHALVRSEAHCSELANARKNGVGSITAYNLETESGMAGFERRCGRESVDCFDARTQ